MNPTDSPTNPERTAGSYTAGQRDKLISPSVGNNEWDMLTLLRAFQKKIGSFQSATDWMAICTLRFLAIAAVIMMILIGVTGFTKMWVGFRESMSESWGSLGKISEKAASTTEQPQQNVLPHVKSDTDSSHATPPIFTPDLKTVEAAVPGEASIAKTSENGYSHRHSNVGLHDAVSGLEYLLLAPLSFLILRSLSEYIEDLSKGKRIWAEMMHRIKTDPGSVKESSEILAALEGSAVSGKTKGSLLDAKALTIGLLFAILATHLVGRIITGSADDKTIVALRDEGLVGIILLIVLGTLYLFVERLSESLKPDKRNSERKRE